MMKGGEFTATPLGDDTRGRLDGQQEDADALEARDEARPCCVRYTGGPIRSSATPT